MELGGKLREQVAVSLGEAVDKASSVLAALHKVQGFIGAISSLSLENSVGIIKDAELTVKSIREETSSLLQTVYLTEIALSSLELPGGEGQLCVVEVSPDSEQPLPARKASVSNCRDCGKMFAGNSKDILCSSCRADNAVVMATPVSSVAKKSSRGTPVQCSHCDAAFVYKRCLAKHVKEAHSSDHDSIVQEVLEQMSSESLTDSHQLMADHELLNKTLGASQELLPEISESQEVVSQEAGGYDSVSDVCGDSCEPVQVIEDGKCGLRLVSGQKFFHCLVCDKVFKRLYRIKRHLQVHDPSRSRVQCHLCSKQFTRWDTLQTHLRAVHTDEKPFSCTFPDCERRFAVQSALVNHLKTHLNGKPYQCQECPETFAVLAQFKSHLSAQHGDTKEQRCSVCFQLFPDAQEMAAHKLKTHTLECEICNKSFAKLGFLKAHLEVHNGPSLFNCRLCNAGFDNEYSYRQHVKTHPKQSTPRASHQCTLCWETFADSKELMEHYNSQEHKEIVGKVSASLPLAGGLTPNRDS